MFATSIHQGLTPETSPPSNLLEAGGLINALIAEHNKASSNAVNVFAYIPPGEWPAIVARTSTFDCRPSVLAAIASRAQGSGADATGATVVFPDGLYNFSGELSIKHKSALIGANSGLGLAGAVEFKFPASTHGIVVYGPGNIGEGKEIPTTTGGDGTLLMGLKVTGGGYSSAGDNFHGIKFRARAKAIGCYVVGFRGDGFHIRASEITALDAEYGNANLSCLDTCGAEGNWGSGLYLEGRDVNAGDTRLFNSKLNGRWGIWDSSFLGNAHYTAHTSANGRRSICHYQGNRYYTLSDTLGGTTTPGTDPAVWVSMGAGTANTQFLDWVSGGSYITGGAFKSDDANARTSFFGCYSEPGNQPPSSVIYPAQVISGHQLAGFTPGSTALIITDGKISKHSTFNTDGGGMHICRNGNEFFAMVAPGDSAVGYAMMTSTASNTIQLRHARFDYRVAIELTTDNSTFTGGRTSPTGPGFSSFPRGAFVAGRFVDAGTAPPTTGEAARGDFRRNTIPTPTGTYGWSCTTGGTNGTTAVWTPIAIAGSGGGATIQPAVVITASTTLTEAAHGDRELEINSASPIVLTLPATATSGHKFYGTNRGAGNVTIQLNGGGAVDRNALLPEAIDQYSAFEVRRLTSQFVRVA